jgi:diadenosine tetraphosphatase ApaH/serine/threonine PP2A family protein phosphatase
LSAWFPRPVCGADLVLTGESAPLDRDTLAAWLCDPAAEEWRDKVGVVGSHEGSAKSSTRLLLASGWVLKTCLDDRGTLLAQRARVARLAHLARTGLWHPDKRFFLLRAPDAIERTEDAWLVASACPRMRTLRAIEGGAEARLDAFADALAWGLRVSRESALGLDLNPSNFAHDEAGTLRYLDDETYPALGPRELGEALAGRMPEEDADALVLGRVARRLVGALEPLLRGSDDWSALVRGVQDYPLVGPAEARRASLVESLGAAMRERHGRRARAPRLTCVLADVHANLPALEAVLAAAREAGADEHVVLGDVVGYGPHPSACIARIAELDAEVCLRGNHDHAVGTGDDDDSMNRMAREVARWTIDALSSAERAWLRALPVEHVADGWLAVHGAPRCPHRFHAYVYELTFRDNLDELRRRGLPLCFYGHTHVPFVHRSAGEGERERLGARDVVARASEILLVNPGSVGQPRDGDPRASFLLWDRRDGRIAFRRVGYPLERTLRDLARMDLPRDLAYRLETGR